MPKKPLTISDWVIALEKQGLEQLAKGLHSDKKEDDKRLVKLGIPVFDRLEQIPYKEFTEENKRVTAFLEKYDRFVVRAIPIKGKSDLPRRPKIGVYTFEECQAFLDELFSQDPKLIGQEENYNVSLVENEPTIGSGIIISNPPKEVLIEVSSDGLDVLSHGEVDPPLSCRIDLKGLGHITDKLHWERKNPRLVDTMWKALRCIELSRDNFNPHFKKGYFEFLVTEKERIVFWDYKANEAYLS